MVPTISKNLNAKFMVSCYTFGEWIFQCLLDKKGSLYRRFAVIEVTPNSNETKAQQAR